VLWPDGGMPGVPVAAVGPATARAVIKAGGLVAVEGRRGSRALVEDLGTVRGRVVVFVHAAGASADTADRLAAKGAVVDAHAVYRTRPIPPGDALVDSVAFASPSAVDGWLLARSLEGMVVASVGETTASYLEGRGHRSDVVATRPTFPSLADALAGRMIERSTE
jgi:uroporphyrinogen-III synthase